MKKIYLAPKGKRMLARFIDFIIMLACSAILYFTAVYPLTFNGEQFKEYSLEMVQLYQDSGLYVTNERGQYAAKSNFSKDVNSLDDLSKLTISLDGYVTEDNNLLKDLYTYYTSGLNEKYGGQITFTYEGYCSTILKVGTETSNIASFDKDNYKLTLIDQSKYTTTIAFFLKAYEDAATTVDSSPVIKTVVDASNQMVIFTVVMIIPVMAGFSFIFDGLVPFFAPYGQTIGKFITHLIVLTNEGHKVNRFKHLFRWLVYFLELAFGIATFGGGLLIPYTMFLFTKKRQCIHDYAAGTVVVDGERSVFYDTAKEEAYITNKLKEKGIDLNEPIDSSREGIEE